MGSCASVPDQSLSYGETCLERGISCREAGDYTSSVEWLFEALQQEVEGRRIECATAGKNALAPYFESHVNILLQIGETFYEMRSFWQSFLFFLYALQIIEEKLQVSDDKTTAVPQYVRATNGIVLVLATVADASELSKKGRSKKTTQDVAVLLYLQGEHPLDVAEEQLARAIYIASERDGARSMLLISLFHLKCRTLLMRRKFREAKPLMQRCLGLSLGFRSIAKDGRVLEKYTRTVLNFVKYHIRMEDCAIKIQRWWREEAFPQLLHNKAMGGRTVEKHAFAGAVFSAIKRTKSQRNVPAQPVVLCPDWTITTDDLEVSPPPNPDATWDAGSDKVQTTNPVLEELFDFLRKEDEEKTGDGRDVVETEHAPASAAVVDQPSHSELRRSSSLRQQPVTGAIHEIMKQQTSLSLSKTHSQKEKYLRREAKPLTSGPIVHRVPSTFKARKEAAPVNPDQLGYVSSFLSTSKLWSLPPDL